MDTKMPFYNQKMRPFLRDLCDDKIDSGITGLFDIDSLPDDKIDRFLALMVEYDEETFFNLEDPMAQLEKKLKIMLLTGESIDKIIFAETVKQEIYNMYKDKMQEYLTEEFELMVMEYEADKKENYKMDMEIARHEIFSE